jgi:cytochrome c oxidase cbb3-type subunit 3
MESVRKGRNGVMPAHETILTPEKIHLLTAYVWSLSNVKEKTSK